MQSCKGIDPLSDTFSENVAKAQQLLRTAVVHSLCTPDEMDAITLVKVKNHLSDPTACGYPRPTDPALGLSAGALYAVLFFSLTGRRANADTCLAVDKEEVDWCDKAIRTKEYIAGEHAKKITASSATLAALLLLIGIFSVSFIVMLFSKT